MPGYTLKCGHRFDHHDLHIRAMSLDVSRARCPVCKEGFTPEEWAYLELVDPTKMTFEEFIESQKQPKPPAPPKPVPKFCNGICKNGKKCAQYTKNVFCRFHS